MHRYTARVDPRHQGGEGVAGTPGACSQVFCHPIRCISWAHMDRDMFAIYHRQKPPTPVHAKEWHCLAPLPPSLLEAPRWKPGSFPVLRAEEGLPRGCACKQRLDGVLTAGDVHPFLELKNKPPAVKCQSTLDGVRDPGKPVHLAPPVEKVCLEGGFIFRII